MKAQPTLDRAAGSERLLVVDPSCGCWATAAMDALVLATRPGDLVVLNDAATLPASLSARTPDGEPVELRLLEAPRDGAVQVALLGAGDWRTPTERRPPAPLLVRGDRLFLGDDEVRVEHVGGRLARIRFHGLDPWAVIYRHGRPVQYSYMADDVPLAAVQTAFATRPWAAEMPSAARPLTWRTLLALRRRGVRLATLTHGAGLSSIDGGHLDRALPLPEWSDIPARTVRAIRQTRAAGGRILAVGTTVTRALEGRIHAAGRLEPGEARTDLILTPDYAPRLVDGLLSNIHLPGESHFELMSAWAPSDVLAAANATAEQRGFRAHEFGDATLILGGSLADIGAEGCVAA